jgi:plastocyanin
VGHRRVQLVVGVAAMALAATTVVGCGSSTKSSSPPTSAGTTSAPASSSSAPVGRNLITIQSFAFHPASLTVAPGATITVHNSDSVTHTLTASGSSKGAFDTGDITPNSTTTFRAPIKSGSYSYICSIHQYMTGTLIVS